MATVKYDTPADKNYKAPSIKDYEKSVKDPTPLRGDELSETPEEIDNPSNKYSNYTLKRANGSIEKFRGPRSTYGRDGTDIGGIEARTRKVMNDYNSKKIKRISKAPSNALAKKKGNIA